MSYIAFDLDALNVARDVGAAAGIPEERVTHGLLRMWAWCFREKTEHVTSVHVAGFFGADCVPALAAFGFLAPSASGLDLAPEINFRVRGAERYLRISEARRRGAEKTNAAKRERTVKRRSSVAQAPLNDALKSAPERSLNDALTPSTEHRAPKEASAPRPSDRLMSDFMEVMGAKYIWQGAKDGTAFATLSASATLDEISKRWRAGLKAPAADWASCRTVAQLASKWNDLASLKEPFVSIEHRPSKVY